jgi:DNA-directed RNA polymerase subunit RPC12/RpoP
MEENEERCIKCGKQEELQGVAVTIGRKTFHLFYLCTKCGDVNLKELLKMIGTNEGRERKT